MTQKSNWPDYPRFMIADPPRVSTIKSPVDGEDGLAVFWSRSRLRCSWRRYAMPMRWACRGFMSGANGMAECISSECGWRSPWVNMPVTASIGMGKATDERRPFSTTTVTPWSGSPPCCSSGAISPGKRSWRLSGQEAKWAAGRLSRLVGITTPDKPKGANNDRLETSSRPRRRQAVFN